ncbi:MAG: nucleotide sugar dehydrogenase, partial [Patescibacteria group bacterium]|nr:nucleotide sugar dehydrogenase [Patescibacteria group bacterium]
IFPVLVPLGTTDKIKTILKSKEKNIEIAYIPENLRLGIAWKRFMHPAMLVIGTQKHSTYRKILDLYKKIKTPKIWVNLRTAEMVKHAINAYLATSISFANEMGNLSEMTGVDFRVVAQILKRDERIGPFARINPGLGFSGGTLARDLRILQELGHKYRIETTLINSVLTVNEWQKKWVVRKLNKIFNNSLKNKTVSILGLTYTPQTSTLRRSLSLETINDLVKIGAKVRGYDPKADREELAKYNNFQLAESFERLVKDSDALVLMTEWNDFRKLKWRKAAKIMRQAIVLDPKNYLNDLNLGKMGYIYIGIGRGNYKNV